MLIKDKLPWWLKMFLKILLSRMPLGYKFWRKIGLFRHGKMDQAEYIFENFNFYCNTSGLAAKDLKGKTILEIGPGDSIGTALVSSSYGAKIILIDVDLYAEQDIFVYQALANRLSSLGLKVPNIDKAKSIDEILEICNAKYLTNGLKSFSNIASDSVDLIVSQAVLEHIKKSDFSNVLNECKRILNKNGIAVHSIDLKDHLENALNNLRFKHNFWESKFISSSGFYTNRIRFFEMIDLFKQAKFIVETSKINKWEKMPTKRKYLSNEFADLSKDDLLVSEFTVLLKHKDEN
jgi:SAM-dependent methyltransferase